MQRFDIRKLVARRYHSPHFNKILIANRGEIAVRVMKTAKKLGIKTVAVYSEADKDSMHTQMADEAYLIGPAASADSYLRMDKILQVAKKSNAQAIHPGYGFLSENAIFAKLLEDNNITFIGPPAQSIIDMGSKSASKNIMINAGVPVVPGYHGDNQDPKFLKQQADEMGYPVLIKAVLGGGGKGMRIVPSSEEFDEMLESAKREALKSFSDDRVLVEKYITKPRHVEVQVFADKLGNAVYLFERDCSVQRRHQKVIEEAPGPGISPELRRSLGEKAVAAAKAVNYVGAGTVEFILDTDTNAFYFMEMNTRLQVEHPVTEMITGTDLVDWQLQVAAGNRLPKLQDELQVNGWAFEARIYAEDPDKNFMPDTGRLVHLKTPDAVPDKVRIETGVRQGDEVSVHYDPMISKLVVWDTDRTEALRVLRKALGEFQVVGPSTNIEFLKSLASHPAFINGDVDTGFIKRHEQELFSDKEVVPAFVIAQAALYSLSREWKNSAVQVSADPYSPWSSVRAFRLNHGFSKRFEFKESQDDKRKIQVDITNTDGSVTVYPCQLQEGTDPSVLVATVGDRKIQSDIVRNGDKLSVFSDGIKHELFLPVPQHTLGESAADQGSVVAPMPCKISHVQVKQGDAVKKGQTLIVLEAMKMEHTIKSPKDGIIQKINYRVGDLVAQGKHLITFE
ncbi:carbamoyl-phosphate synthase L chain, ATP binding domain-containing protein [Gorgonomyces haynaldii]|nr:carbamoyl-phosphate synthase L chain, ATP binding domain-containing protein [Gorgonomyces haynaldii]